MFLSKSVISSLMLIFLLSACGGGDDFNVNGLNGSAGDTTATETGGDSTETEDTPTSAGLDLGTGFGDSFSTGGLTTSIGSSQLSYGGDAVITVNVVDSSDNSLYTDGSVTVSFTSICALQEFSTIDATVITTTGVAVATYSANSCEGFDTISATLNNNATATAIIDVAGQVLGALEFVSATPSSISLSGSGSSANPDLSTVSFSLKDKTGAAMAGETITYKVSTEVGGISLSSSSSVTDADGVTSIQLNAGGVNVSVVVIASVEVDNGDGTTSTTTTTSDPIAILGGIPDQNSFSISVETVNPTSWDYDGVTSAITVRAADRYNNQARDGTQISFITDGGSIIGACQLAGGACSVNWTSQDPRPSTGLIHILARTAGEESFTDSNSNGKYDIGEIVEEHLNEAFLDVDGSGTRNNDNEFFSDFNNNGSYDLKGNTNFKGTNCTNAAIAAGHCANLVDVRQETFLCMSADEVTLTTDAVGNVVDTANVNEYAEVTLIIKDENGLTPPQETKITISIEDGEIISGGTPSIGNACSTDGFVTTIRVGPDDDVATAFGTLTISVEQNNGVSLPQTNIRVLH
jgi:hypothetical protein